MEVSPGVSLDLQAAAEELGVHYQTAYRWVREGRLEAELVGGRYRIGPSDLSDFDDRRRSPAPPAPPGRKRLGHAAERVHTALVTGDESSVSKITGRLVGEGTPMIDLMQIVVSPAMRRIGLAWSEDEISISVEHRASAIVERVLGELAPNPRGRRRGRAMVAAVTGDRHSLPTTMAAVALRDDHWHVEHLGADMPPGEIVKFCTETPISVAVITVTNPDAARLAGVTAGELRDAGTPTVVGGPGRTLDDLIRAVRDPTRA